MIRNFYPALYFKGEMGNMGTMGIYIVFDIIMSYLLLSDVYERISAGKFIIKTKVEKVSVLYIILLVLCLGITGFDIVNYLENKKIYINGVLQGTFLIQFCVLNLLNRTPLGITKGGIYSGNVRSSNFTKWNRIRSYTWISDNVVQLELLGKGNKIVNTDLEVNKEQIEEINKLLKESINKTDSVVDKKRNSKIIVATALIGIIMTMGYINIIKISKPYMIKKVKLSEEEAITVLKNTWKPLEELHKENIKSKEDFYKTFEKTMSKSMIDDLYGILVDENTSKDGAIKFKENVIIPNPYNTKISILKSYMKLPKYEEKIKQANIIEELTIEEEFMQDRFRRESTFIKNDNGDWILNRITGTESIES